MVIYPNPLFGVIFMITLHVSIIKHYPKLFSNYYPKFTFWIIYSFLCVYEKLYINSISLNITRLYERKWQCSHYFGIMFLIDTMISDSNYMVITILIFKKFSITPMCLIVRTDGITMYDIINFSIEVFNFII